MKHPFLTALAAFALLPFVNHAQSPESLNRVTFAPTDTDADKIRKAAFLRPSPRQVAWQQYELTGFIHFGMNTFTNREWGEGTEDPHLFNPTQLDARQWVRTAREFGMNELILTVKHHDGFCLWPTKTTRHSVASSPWKDGEGDLVRDVSEACKQYGIKFGVYISPWDRNQAKFGIYGTDEYNDYFKTQLRELLTSYGPVAEVWFDGANGEGKTGKKQVYDWNGFYRVVRELQPNAVISISGPDVRWVGNESGEGRDTEWSVVPLRAAEQDVIAANSQQVAGSGVFVPSGDRMDNDLGSRAKILASNTIIWYPSVVNNSFRPGWFYHPEEDEKQRTVEKLVDNYYNSVGKNSVWLLNFSPDKRGLIHENDVKILRESRAKLVKTFAKDLTVGAQVTALGGAKDANPKTVLDHDNQTFWTTPENTTVGIIELNWPQPVTVDQLLLQENFRNGQRVESFVLEKAEGPLWKEVARGTTIGYKRLLRFAPVTTAKLRLRITQSRANPEITALELYSTAK